MCQGMFDTSQCAKGTGTACFIPDPACVSPPTFNISTKPCYMVGYSRVGTPNGEMLEIQVQVKIKPGLVGRSVYLALGLSPDGMMVKTEKPIQYCGMTTAIWILSQV